MGILQARILEWVVMPSSRGSFQPRSPTLQEDSLPSEPSVKPKNTGVGSLSLLQGIFLIQELNLGCFLAYLAKIKWWFRRKASVYNVGDLVFDPWVWKFPGEGNGNPLQYSCLEKSHGWRSLVSMGSQRVGHDWATSLFFFFSFSPAFQADSLPAELPGIPSPHVTLGPDNLSIVGFI